MNVITFRVGEDPAIEDMELELETFQEFVGGEIETIMLCCMASPEYVLIRNEEGSMSGLPVNRCIYSDGDKDYPGDIVMGDFLICRAEGDEFAGVKESDLEDIEQFVGEVLR